MLGLLTCAVWPNPIIGCFNTTKASWRSGDAADCKSQTFSNRISPLSRIRYLDIPETDGESDNRRSAVHAPTKNAATSPKARGVNSQKKADNFRANHTPKRGRNAMSLYAKPAHKAVAKSLGYALTLGTEAAWFDVSVILAARLAETERAALAYAALRSLDPEQAEMVAATALATGAGQPIAPLFNQMDEAAFWADMAEPGELEAYCLVSFNRMAPGRQAAFLDFAVGSVRGELEGIGVDHKTVGAARDELEESGEIPHFSQRRDPRTGNLSQPARKPIRTEFIATSKAKAHDA